MKDDSSADRLASADGLHASYVVSPPPTVQLAADLFGAYQVRQVNSFRAYGRYPAYPVWEIGLAALVPFGIAIGAAMTRMKRRESARA